MSDCPIVGFDHVQLAMPAGGEDAARAFYAGVLGLAEVPKPADLATRGGCWFEGGGVSVHLGVDANFRPAAKAHPALLVEDLAAMRDRLEAYDVAFTDGSPLDGYRRGDICDPFGNRIELMQKL
ncbi:Glyoxalase-like domain protein [Tsuneonella dongtanensis]|uniref:Glyoxalase-like domain protein n=1 Tax=Tsuneonella dongtanensis TaxID=692370 RepID=A0A1B2ADK1_9SPHN|nr:VOC family protein [Tsuneonella dongtanensis]ANY20214.1 Glyoxalase-like domain protein [Tsuneonella dongtanensis]